MTFDVDSIGLPKWPAMVVVGEHITSQQAMEILVRTDHWSLGTNDKEWARAVREVVGLPPDEWEANVSLDTLKERWAATDRFRAELGVLDLEYLGNSQIASAYIGGPHGWSDWNGRIGTSSYNIGKYPDAATVLQEWQTIAAAFPFLRLWCQLFNGEQCEAGTRAVVEYVIAEGRAIAQAPTDRTQKPTEGDIAGQIEAIARGYHGRERGCTLERLRHAVSYVRALRGPAVPSPREESK